MDVKPFEGGSVATECSKLFLHIRSEHEITEVEEMTKNRGLPSYSQHFIIMESDHLVT